jgi:hypothetical protein
VTVVDKPLGNLRTAVRLLKNLAPLTDKIAAHVDARDLVDLERAVTEAGEVLNKIREDLGSRRAALAVN